jgi:hypothetical protein
MTAGVGTLLITVFAGVILILAGVLGLAIPGVAPAVRGAVAAGLSQRRSAPRVYGWSAHCGFR